MERVKLLQNHLPIDRVAARVIKKAKPEALWQPAFLVREDELFSREVLPTKEFTGDVPDRVQAVLGKRRGNMTIVGYSALQPKNGRKPAKWVVRCDCGNFETRIRILRWLGIDEHDACRECNARKAKLKTPYVHRSTDSRSVSA